MSAGNPDLSFPGRRKVILVQGCFWHQHNCRLGRKIPASSTEYWHPKLAGNVARDEYVRAELARLGWDVLVIWECEKGTFLHSRSALRLIWRALLLVR